MKQTTPMQTVRTRLLPLLLVLLLLGAGLFFSIRTRFVQLRLFPEACRLIFEKPRDGQRVSSLQALLVSTASRVDGFTRGLPFRARETVEGVTPSASAISVIVTIPGTKIQTFAQIPK